MDSVVFLSVLSLLWVLYAISTIFNQLQSSLRLSEPLGVPEGLRKVSGEFK